jgi:glutaredoxin 3
MSEVTVYTLEHCPYCVKAKNLLKQNEIAFKEVRVSDNDVCTRSELQDRTGMKTFPQIFHGNKLIGGFSDLLELEQAQGLKNVF